MKTEKREQLNGMIAISDFISFSQMKMIKLKIDKLWDTTKVNAKRPMDFQSK